MLGGSHTGLDGSPMELGGSPMGLGKAPMGCMYSLFTSIDILVGSVVRVLGSGNLFRC